MREISGVGIAGLTLDLILKQLPVSLVVAEAPSGRIARGGEYLDELWRGKVGHAERVADYVRWGGYRPDGSRYSPEDWPLARSVLTGESVMGEEIRITRGDGTRGFLRVSSAPVLDAGGERIAATAVLQEVTDERRRVRARKLLAEASSLLSSTLDLHTTLRNTARLVVPTLADWCAIDLLGDGGRIERLVVEHHDPALRQAALELERRYSPRPGSAAGVAKVISTGEAEIHPRMDDRLTRRIAQDARHRTLLEQLGFDSVMILPLKTRGRTLGSVVFARAGGENAYEEEDLQLGQELALRAAAAIENATLYHASQAANRAKADFLAIISHELRTPLTAIIGYAELLSLGVPEPIGERQKEQVERIEISAQHLLQLIEEILTMANLESGVTELRPRPMRVHELVERARLMIEPLARASGIQLEVEPVASDLELISDPDKLLQVLLNLLSNAVKFTDHGEVRLRVHRRTDEVAFTVEDTGIGLHPEHREKIFQPFWQVEQPITRRVGGTGLGLAITQRLLSLLGGRVEVESEPGLGSRFTAFVPFGAGNV